MGTENIDTCSNNNTNRLNDALRVLNKMCTNLKCSLASLVAAGDWDYVTQYGADVVNQLLDHRTSTYCGCELQSHRNKQHNTFSVSFIFLVFSHLCLKYTYKRIRGLGNY